VVHPHDTDTVYVMPLEPATRSCPGGAPAVWRSENGGESWNRLARGLPKKQSYFTVLRDAMDIDRLKTPAVYIYPPIGQTVDDGHDFLHLGVNIWEPDVFAFLDENMRR
jgi:hypothetical protein